MPVRLTARAFPFLAQLSEAGRRELSQLSAVAAAPGRQVLRRGAPAGGAYLVTRGVLRVFYIHERGRESTLYRVEPGGTCILALASTFEETPYPAWVAAGPEGADVVRIEPARLHRLVEREGPFRTFVLGALTSRIVELMRSLEDAKTSSVEARLLGYLEAHVDAGGSLAITQAALASELGTVREVVSRHLRALARRGLVRTARGKIVLRGRSP